MAGQDVVHVEEMASDQADAGEAHAHEATGALETLLVSLDDHPATEAELAAELDVSQDHVRAGLQRAERAGLAVCWGEVWATTWRAKLQLHPGFFRTWIPASLALGALLTALALWLNGPAQTQAWSWGLGGLAAGAALVAGLSAVRSKW